jgi:hypothetical protein
VANYVAVAEAMRLAEKDTALLRQVMKMREEKSTGSSPGTNHQVAALNEPSERLPSEK